SEENLDLVRLEGAVGTDQLLEQCLRLGGAKRVRTECAHPERSELGVAEEHGVRGAPLELGHLARGDEVDLGLEGAVESEPPPAERGQEREVFRRELMGAGLKHVCNASAIDEDGGLTRPHHEARSVLDLVLVARKAPDERVPVVVDPFDDVDQLAAELVHESHRFLLDQTSWRARWRAPIIASETPRSNLRSP